MQSISKAAVKQDEMHLERYMYMCLYNYLCVQYFKVQEIQHKKSPLEQTDGDVRKERCNVAYY